MSEDFPTKKCIFSQKNESQKKGEKIPIMKKNTIFVEMGSVANSRNLICEFCTIPYKSLFISHALINIAYSPLISTLDLITCLSIASILLGLSSVSLVSRGSPSIADVIDCV